MVDSIIKTSPMLATTTPPATTNSSASAPAPSKTPTGPSDKVEIETKVVDTKTPTPTPTGSSVSGPGATSGPGGTGASIFLATTGGNFATVAPSQLSGLSGPGGVNNPFGLLSLSGPAGRTLSLDNIEGLGPKLAGLSGPAFTLTELKTLGLTLSGLDPTSINLTAKPAGLTGVGSFATSGPAGSGPAILFIDDGDLHQKATQTIGERFGAGAAIISESIPLGGGDNTLPVVTATGPNGIDAWIDDFSKAPGEYAKILKDMADKHPDTDVINMSFGLSRAKLYDNIYTGILTGQFQNDGKPIGPTELKALQEKLGITDPGIITSVQKAFNTYREDAKAGKLTEEEYAAKLNDLYQQDPNSLALQKYITTYVDKTMDAPDSTFSKSLKEYQEVTKQLAERGQIVVVSAGNDHGGYWTTAKFADGVQDQEFNMLAMSEHVISVAATEDNNPNTKVAPFSSRGGETKGWKPTISADGVDTNTGVFNKDGNEVEDGTSFSAPTVSGAIAAYLKNHPGASFEQVKRDLLKTADHVPGATPGAEGAGVLDYKEFTGMTAPDNDNPKTWPSGASSTPTPTPTPTPTGASPSPADQEILNLAKRRNDMFLAVQNLQKDPNSVKILDSLDALMGRGKQDGSFNELSLYDLAKLRPDDMMWQALQVSSNSPALNIEERAKLIAFAKTITQVSTDEDNIAEITGEKRGFQDLMFDPGDIQKWLDSHQYWQLPTVSGPGS